MQVLYPEIGAGILGPMVRTGNMRFSRLFMRQVSAVLGGSMVVLAILVLNDHVRTVLSLGGSQLMYRQGRQMDGLFQVSSLILPFPLKGVCVV